STLTTSSTGTAYRTLSSDGRYEVFTSSATDLVHDISDTNGSTDVFVRDRLTGTTTLVSVNSDGTASGDSSSDSPVISANGRYVAFRSYANNLINGLTTDGNSDIYVRDLQTKTKTLVSVETAAANGGNASSDD